MKSNRVFITIAAVVLLACGVSFFKFPSSSADESSLVKMTASHFLSSSEPIYLRDVTSFEWDKLCFLSENSVAKHTSDVKLQQLIEADLTGVSVKDIGYLSPENKYKAAFVFILDGKIQKIIHLSSSFLRLGESKAFWGTKYKRNCMTSEQAKLLLVQGAHAAHIVISDQ